MESQFAAIEMSAPVVYVMAGERSTCAPNIFIDHGTHTPSDALSGVVFIQLQPWATATVAFPHGALCSPFSDPLIHKSSLCYYICWRKHNIHSPNTFEDFQGYYGTPLITRMLTP